MKYNIHRVVQSIGNIWNIKQYERTEYNCAKTLKCNTILKYVLPRRREQQHRHKPTQIIKICRNSTKFWQKQICTGDTWFLVVFLCLQSTVITHGTNIYSSVRVMPACDGSALCSQVATLSSYCIRWWNCLVNSCSRTYRTVILRRTLLFYGDYCSTEWPN